MKTIIAYLFSNWKTKVISILVAAGLWMYTHNLKFKSVTISIPVTYKGLPQGVQFQKEPRRFLKLKVRGTEENIKFPTGNLTAEVDLNNAVPGKRDYLVYFDVAQIPEKIDILEKINSVTIHLARSVEKRLRVQVELRGRLPKGYRRGQVTVTPDEVLVIGATSRLENMKYISTRSVSLSGARKSINRTVKLNHDRNLLRLPEVSVVWVSIPIYQAGTTNEIIISSVAISAKNLDPALEVHFSSQVVNVQVQGDINILKKITASDLQAEIDLQGTLFNPKTGRILPFANEPGIPVKVRPVRDGTGIKILTISPDSLTVRFKVKPEFLTEKPENEISPPKVENE